MIEFNHELIHNQDNFGSSALIFDLRNSTKITRKISWDPRIVHHVEFMWKIHQFLYKKISGLPYSDKIALNDTGDGYLCVFWDDQHAISCMRIAIELYSFLKKNIPIHNQKMCDEKDDIPKFGYGFGLHSGGSTIIRSKINWDDEKIHKDFIYGIVANSVARLESITKNYPEFNFLISGNYNHTLKKQLDEVEINSILKKKINDFDCLGRVDIKDGKSEGHKIYGINEEFLEFFQENIDSLK